MRGLTSLIQRWTPFLHLQRRRTSLHFTSHQSTSLTPPTPPPPLPPPHPTPLHSLHHTHFPQSHHRAALTAVLTTRNKQFQLAQPALHAPPAPSPTPPSSARTLSSTRLAPVVPVPVPVSVRPPPPLAPPPRQHLVACATEAILMHAAQHSG